MKIKALMIKNPITIGPRASVSEAIELMKKNSIRHLPVVTKGKKLYGFLTLADLKQGLIPSMLSDISLDDLMIKAPTDMLRTFIDMMGILSTTSRIDVVLGNQPAAFKKAMQIINDNGGDIINVSMTPQRKGKRVYYFRLSACKTQIIKKALESERFEVLAAMD
jgi:acetoin utilization protein AcuB